MSAVPILALLAVIAPPDTADEPEEIVVTGERIPRSLRETPSSVYVATQRDIELQSADRVEQVLALIPNVQVSNGSQGPSIRGQDTTGALVALPAFLGGNRPRTAVVVDGRRTTYNEFVFGVAPVWDVDRIEVFRSPQTTTQGQNSIAGAIFVNMNDPTFVPEYRARAIVGNYKSRELSLLASGPIVEEQIAFRVAGDIRYSQPTSHIVDRVEDGDPNHDRYGLLRAKLLIKPASLPGTRIELTYAHVQSQAPQLVGVTKPFSERRDEQGGYGVFRINVDSITADLGHKFTDDLGANLVLTGGDSEARRLAPSGLGQTRIDGRDWSGEAVLNWSPDGPMQIVGGLSHSHLALKQFINLSRLSGIGRFRDKQNGTGIFGEVNLAIVPRVTVTAGLRYQYDRQQRSGTLDGRTSAIPLDFDGRFNAWMPKVSISYDFSPEVRAGLLVQRAYNPGGTTLRFDTGQPDNFDAETLWDYELFMRTNLAGGRLRAEANLFYYDIHNAQRAKDIVILTPDGFQVGFSDLFNVPKAHSYGLELNIDWRASKRLSARIGLGLLDTKIVEAGDSNPDYEGKQFERAPHFTFSASGDWRASDRLLFSAQLRHNGDYFNDDLNDPTLRVGGFTYVNARAEWNAGPVTLFAYARNVFDNFYMTSLGSAEFGTAGDPREMGLGIEGRF